MTLDQTVERRELRHLVSALMDERSREARVRAVMADGSGLDRSLWTSLAELGLTGIGIPERLGGGGAGASEIALVLEGLGSSLAVAPYLACVALARTAVLAADDDRAAAEHLPGIAAGTTIATVAGAESRVGWQAHRWSTRAEQTASGWRVYGHKSGVVDAQHAQLVLVYAGTSDGLCLFAVNPDRDGVEVVALPAVDPTRGQCRILFDGAAATPIGRPDPTLSAFDRFLDIASILLGAEQVGGMARALELAVEHAKVREQFGRPIGSFQAVQHLCADMLVAVEGARSAVSYALVALESGSDEVPVCASAVGIACSDAYVDASAKLIQICGGIGVTWEHPAHLYYKRARTSAVLLRDVRSHRRRLAGLVGL